MCELHGLKVLSLFGMSVVLSLMRPIAAWSAVADTIVPPIQLLLLSGKQIERIGMVKDINQWGSGDPDYLTVFNELLFFRANNGVNGSELWKSNGSEEGTVLVSDINPSGDSYPGVLTVLDGVLYFTAYEGGSSHLWKSDGTAQWTVKVHDVTVWGDPVNRNLTIYNDELYFKGMGSQEEGAELWKSNGTYPGTILVKDINTASMGSSDPMHLFVNDGALYFMADDGSHGIELWKSDGTGVWTGMVKDICPLSCDAFHIWWSNFAEYNGELYFSARDATHGYELWKSNGTEPGTFMVKDINPSSGMSSPSELIVYNGLLYFGAYDGSHYSLWKTDGSTAGTLLITDKIGPALFTVFHDLLYFFATDNTTFTTGLWKSDGTGAGTVLVKEISLPPGANTNNFYQVYNGLLYFPADDGIHGVELWRSDGTEAGTVMVEDINPSGDSSPRGLIIYNNALYFAADNGIHGNELWKLEWVME